MIHTGDCVEVMAGMEPDSIDAIVTDPPYGLSFMGKDWDDLSRVPDHTGPQWGGYGWHGQGPTPAPVMQEWHTRWATEALRVAKPGAYLLAFGGTRTVHRLTVALEDSGWIIRDLLVWAYASGFPKSKSSLKPAWEPIVLARKPGPLRAFDIEGCRIGVADGFGGGASGTSGFAEGYQHGDGFTASQTGRWPANVILTDPVFDGGWDGVVGGGEARSSGIYQRGEPGPRLGPASIPLSGGEPYGDIGTYSRFFLIPKASRSDREPKVPGELEASDSRTMNSGLTGVSGDCSGRGGNAAPLEIGNAKRSNTHPTVKPTALMRHLIRLVTPPGGTVLDPFLGSGTTAKAAVLEGFDWVGIEREPEYIRIAEQRLVGLVPEPQQLEMTA